MNKRLHTWGCGALVASIGLLSLLGVLLLIRALSHILWSQEAAGWVQAIGSIAAIIGTYHLGERHAARTKRDHLAGLFAICQAAIDRINLAHEIFCGDNATYNRRMREFSPDMVIAIVGALDRVSIHEIGNPRAVIAMLELRDQLQFIAACAKELLSPVELSEAGSTLGLMIYTRRVRDEQVRNIKVHIDAARPLCEILANAIRHR